MKLRMSRVAGWLLALFFALLCSGCVVAPTYPPGGYSPQAQAYSPQDQVAMRARADQDYCARIANRYRYPEGYYFDCMRRRGYRVENGVVYAQPITRAPQPPQYQSPPPTYQTPSSPAPAQVPTPPTVPEQPNVSSAPATPSLSPGASLAAHRFVPVLERYGPLVMNAAHLTAVMSSRKVELEEKYGSLVVYDILSWHYALASARHTTTLVFTLNYDASGNVTNIGVSSPNDKFAFGELTVAKSAALRRYAETFKNAPLRKLLIGLIDSNTPVDLMLCKGLQYLVNKS
jgi:hypothetical protein